MRHTASAAASSVRARLAVLFNPVGQRVDVFTQAATTAASFECLLGGLGHFCGDGALSRYFSRSPDARAPVASTGMTSRPCLFQWSGGGVAGTGDIDGPLIGTGPQAGLFVTRVPASTPDR